MITLTIPNDDHIALRAFGKALEEMALAHGAEPRKTVGELSYKLDVDTTQATAALERLSTATGELMQVAPGQLQIVRELTQIDTTAQQVESLVPGNEYVPTVKPEPEITFTDTQGEQTVPTTDSTNAPWDERIHSASKALNSDGTWRLRRKPKDMDETEWADYVTMIKADLQYPVECGGEEPPALEEVVNEMIEAAHAGIAQEFGKGIANAAFTGNSSEPPVTPPGDDFHTDAGVVTEQAVAGIPPIPVPPPVALPGSTGATDLLPPAPIPTAVTPVDTWDFPKLMKFLTERHGKIDVPTVNQLLAVDGLAALTDLNVHPDKIGPFVARVKAHLGE